MRHPCPHRDRALLDGLTLRIFEDYAGAITAALAASLAGRRGELYDLNADPDCFRNLWDAPEAAALQRRMLDTLIQLMVDNVDPLPPRVGAC